jgi:hypothetical protein
MMIDDIGMMTDDDWMMTRWLDDAFRFGDFGLWLMMIGYDCIYLLIYFIWFIYWFIYRWHHLLNQASLSPFQHAFVLVRSQCSLRGAVLRMRVRVRVRAVSSACACVRAHIRQCAFCVSCVQCACVCVCVCVCACACAACRGVLRVYACTLYATPCACACACVCACCQSITLFHHDLPNNQSNPPITNQSTDQLNSINSPNPLLLITNY